MTTGSQPAQPAESLLKHRLTDDLKQAMREGKKTRVDTLRLLISAVNYAEIAKQAPLTDPDVLGVIAREIRQRNESIEAFKKGNRQDLIDTEQAEITVLQEYQPKQMTSDEILVEVKKVIAEVGAKGPGDKGKVMQRIMAELKGKADGREINAVVTELLSR